MVIQIMNEDDRLLELRAHMQRSLLERCGRDAFETAMMLHLAISELEQGDTNAAMLQLQDWDFDFAIAARDAADQCNAEPA